MSRIVFFSIPAYGHTNPTVEVVRQLVRRGHRGHRGRYYSFEEFQVTREGAGAEFVPCDAFLPPAPRDLGRRMGHDFSSLMAMVIDVTVAMEEKALRELGEFRPDCVVADSICIWGKLYARRLGLPMVCSTTTFAFDRAPAGAMRPGPLEVFYTLTGLPQIGKRLALLREHGYEVKKLTELIQNDSETDTIVYTSRAFQPGGEHFGERVAFVGRPCRSCRPGRSGGSGRWCTSPWARLCTGTPAFTGPARRAWGTGRGMCCCRWAARRGRQRWAPCPPMSGQRPGWSSSGCWGRHRCFSPTVG